MSLRTSILIVVQLFSLYSYGFELPAEVLKFSKICHKNQNEKAILVETTKDAEYKGFKIPKDSLVVLEKIEKAVYDHKKLVDKKESIEIQSLLSKKEIKFDKIVFKPLTPVLLEPGYSFRFFVLGKSGVVNDITFPAGSMFWFYQEQLQEIYNFVHFSLVKTGQGVTNFRDQELIPNSFLCFDEDFKKFYLKEDLKKCAHYPGHNERDGNNQIFRLDNFFIKSLVSRFQNNQICSNESLARRYVGYMRFAEY